VGGASAGFISAADQTKLDNVAVLSDTDPVDVDKSTAAEGTASEASRQDHKHDVSTGTPVSVTTANAEGTATSLARSDHAHDHGDLAGGSLHDDVIAAGASGFMTGADKTKLNSVDDDATNTPLSDTDPVNVTKAAAAEGTATEAARQDHKHDVSTAAPAATGVGTASAEGTATTLARSDHAHQSNTAPADVTKAAAAIGTNGEPARADHKHDVSTATPSTVGTSNSEGTATSLARSDHVHNHGDQGGGTLHAGATGRLHVVVRQVEA
jgi:hypothetical protein